MKNKSVVEIEAGRKLTFYLEPVSGSITMFYTFINSVRVIQANGSKKRSWSGDVPDSQVRAKIRVTGVGNASFKVGIDLPGTANDQTITFNLTDGYYEADFTL